jgi:hypothetical protein
MTPLAFNFDLGIKNYKKNRLIVDSHHLKNEILYNMENAGKTSFNISAFSYYNNQNKGFLDSVRDIEASSLSGSFHFFINENGNLFTDLEMSSESYFYPDETSSLNVVVCISGKSINLDNKKKAQSLYRYNQLKTLNRFIKTFEKNSYQTTLKSLSVDNNYEKITNLGFDILQYGEEVLNND